MFQEPRSELFVRFSVEIYLSAPYAGVATAYIQKAGHGQSQLTFVMRQRFKATGGTESVLPFADVTKRTKPIVSGISPV